MNSKAFNHFPRLISQGDKPVLFNPILKKRFKNRPEERVRLKWVEFLVHQTEWPQSRIGFEAPVKLQQAKNTLRADLILYNKDMSPQILIECKAESIKLNSAVAEQAARYNQGVGAPYICLTNGISDFWYRVENNSISTIEPDSDPDFPLKSVKNLSALNRDLSYWRDRGFCAGKFTESTGETLQQTITHFWSGAIEWPINFLNFPNSPFEFGLQHYYRIPIIDNEQKLAISFIGSPAGSSHLVAILNRKGENHGILSINLNRLAENHSGSAFLFQSGNQGEVDAKKHLPFFEHGFSQKQIEQLPHYLMRFFV